MMLFYTHILDYHILYTHCLVIIHTICLYNIIIYIYINGRKRPGSPSGKLHSPMAALTVWAVSPKKVQKEVSKKQYSDDFWSPKGSILGSHVDSK